jgi:hypothetical protein
MAKKLKSARHVAAGQARHARLRAELGDAGYRAYQQQAQAAAVARHPGLASRAGKVGYRATVQKYGIEWAKKRLDQANEANRTRRLANPTAGEQALCDELRRRGYTVHADLGQVFDYFVWMQDPEAANYGQVDAIREAKIGHYYADILIPAARLIIEVYGGVHQLNPARDAQRCAWLQEQGFVVVVITEEEATAPIRLAAVLDQGGGHSRIAVAPARTFVPPLQHRRAA